LDVLNQSINIAEKEGVQSSEELLLLKIAALYHDTGFLYIYKEHEEKSCEIAWEELRQFNVPDNDILIICEMIRATKIPQSPKSYLGQILCDADLDYLGRHDFYSIGEGLYKEFIHQQVVRNEIEWNKLQVNFLENHNYFTSSSKQGREELKQQHLNELRLKISGA
jgi:predicted metal-dependent HD superfamily phosphohydrolase